MSFSSCMGGSFRQTVAGIFSDKRMDSKLMQEGHLQSTKERILSSEGDYILVAQDTTYYNYSGHVSMEGLGKIQGQIRGIIQHNSLAMSQEGVPLGLIDQQYWSREGSVCFEGKESQKWERSLESVSAALGSIDKKVVLIEDREADIFSFFEASQSSSVAVLVRVHQPRNMEIETSGKICKLSTMTDKLRVIGHKEVSIYREGKEVRLTIALQASRVNVIDDIKAKKQKKTESLSLVIAQEVAALDARGQSVFKEENKAIWYLLTSLPTHNQEDIERIVEFYSLRWRIERFHYTMKSGALNVERLQFDDLKTTLNALSFYSVVAWQILAITYFLRQEKEQPAESCFEENEIQVLKNLSNKPIKTVKDATLALVKIVGFTPSKKQPMPGIKVIAQAFDKLYYIKLGYNAKPK